MSNGRAIRMEFETLRSIAFGAIPTGTFVGGNIGGPMLHGIVQFKVDNTTNQLLIFSIDGLHPHFVVPASTGFVSDVSSNRLSSEGLYLAKGDSFYVQYPGAAPTSGTVYVSVVFGDTGY
jgi:hypothetical protein